jgi:hypothetical protein
MLPNALFFICSFFESQTGPMNRLVGSWDNQDSSTQGVTPVDATILSRKKRSVGCTRSKPSQGSVLIDLTLASDLAFVFNASWVRPECCVDPLRPPRLSGVRQGHDRSTSTIRRLTGNLGAPEKSFRAKRLYNVDALGACRRQHRRNDRSAEQHKRRNDHGQCARHF